MSKREVRRRLMAFAQGAPVPRTEKRSFEIASASDTFVVAFLRMGGESRPWAIAFGHPDETPTVLHVPDGRQRTPVSTMVAEFGEALCEHLQIPGFSSTDPEEFDDLNPHRQLWLPSSAHLDMLHHLAFTYCYCRFSDDLDLQRTLRMTGQCCSFLFREFSVPGQQAIMVGSSALTSLWSFPSEDARQGHLGYLLAWLGAGVAKGQSRSDAAVAAEKLAISTTLDPEIERSELAPLVEGWNLAQRDGDTRQMATFDRKIEAVLTREVLHRWNLSVRARQAVIDSVRPTNAYAELLTHNDVSRRWHQLCRPASTLRDDNPDYIPGFARVDTDGTPETASKRYFQTLAADEQLLTLLLHDDRELLLDSVESGDSIEGVITEVMDVAPPHTGRGRAAVRPLWRIADPHGRVLKLREGTSLAVCGVPSRTVTVHAINEVGSGYEILVEITGKKTASTALPYPHNIAPTSPQWKGQRIALVPTSGAFFSEKKRGKIDDLGSAPGAWLVASDPTMWRARPEGMSDDTAQPEGPLE